MKTSCSEVQSQKSKVQNIKVLLPNFSARGAAPAGGQGPRQRRGELWTLNLTAYNFEF